MKKKITAILGSTVIGGAVAVAAIAQTCNNNDGDVVANENIIVEAINSLSNYIASDSPVTGLALNIVRAINTNLSNPSDPFIVAELSITNISRIDNITQTGSESFQATNLRITGSGTFSSDVNAIFFVAQSPDNLSVMDFTFNNDDTITIDGITNLSSQIDVSDTIIGEVNELSSYRGETGISDLAEQVLALASQRALSENGTFTNPSIVDFNTITRGDVDAINNVYTINMSNFVMFGEINNEGAYAYEPENGLPLVLTITFDPSDNSFTANNLPIFLTVATFTPAFEIAMGVGRFDNSGPSAATREVINAIDLQLSMLLNNDSILTLSFPSIERSDVTMIGNIISITPPVITATTTQETNLTGLTMNFLVNSANGILMIDSVTLVTTP